MIKRTIYIGNRAKLRLENAQLLIDLSSHLEVSSELKSVPVEDIGILLIDTPQVTLSTALINFLMASNVVVITCDEHHMPHGCMLPYAGNTLLTERYRMQIEASEPLKKQFWQQIVSAKIRNQAGVLANIGIEATQLRLWANEVASGDSRNVEGAAAAWYFDKLFTGFITKFKRAREGDAPNNVLNYTYAIIRAIVARAIVGAGLLPALGVHHRNKYNPYCLADDLMEPFRPYADALALELIRTEEDISTLSKSVKGKLLMVAQTDVQIGGQTSPLFNAAQKLVDSYVNCLKGVKRKLELPQMH